MIQRVVIINQNEAVVCYLNGKQLRLYSDYNIRDMVTWFLDNKVVNIYDEHRRAMKTGVEDTQEIKVG